MQNPCKSLKSAIPSQYNENDIILKLRDLAGVPLLQRMTLTLS
jgi:hypothetical protein